MSTIPRRPTLIDIYGLLRGRFGFLDWWPGDTADEIFIGAILTQQTSWKNVEKAIANLKRARIDTIRAISGTSARRLESLVRPSGYYRQKAARLRSISRFIIGNYGSLDGMLSMERDRLRETLLSLNGVGEETADSIALYAAGKLSFVIDAYTRRAVSRIYGDTGEDAPYSELKSRFEAEMGRKLWLYKDMHAQFVELGKNFCRKREPLCAGCPLNNVCAYGRSQV